MWLQISKGISEKSSDAAQVEMLLSAGSSCPGEPALAGAALVLNNLQGLGTEAGVKQGFSFLCLFLQSVCFPGYW